MLNILVVPAAVLFLVWSACTWMVLSRGRGVSPMHGWMLGLSFFVVLPLTIVVLNGGYQVPSYYGIEGDWGTLDLRDERYTGPYFFVCASMLLTALTAAWLYRHVPTRAAQPVELSIDGRRLARVVGVCVGIAFVDAAVNIHLNGGIASYFLKHWYTRHADPLAAYGEAFVLYMFLMLGVQLVLTAAAGICILRKVQTGQGGRPLALILAAMLLNMVMSGNRIFIALILLFVVAVLVHHRRYGAMLKLAMLAPVLVLVFAVWAQVRGALSDPVAAIDRHIESASTYEGNYVLNRLIDVTEGTNIIFLLNIKKDFGERYQYLGGVTFMKAVTFWIPRSVYPEKPDSFPVITARLYEPGVETSISSTILGELYANFGVFSLMLLPLLTVAVCCVDEWTRLRRQPGVLLSAALFLGFAWMARASFSDNVVMLGFAALIVWALRLDRGLAHGAGVARPVTDEARARGGALGQA